MLHCRRRLARALLVSVTALTGSAVSAEFPPGWVNGERLASPAAGREQWLTTGGDAGKSHYSRLARINKENVAQLGLAWEYHTGTNRGLEATPIVVDGVMYTSGVAGRVYALDAVTGGEIWTFTPAVDMQVNRAACCDMVNRGVAVWQGKVYVAALDGMLYALNAASGEVLWQADTIVDRGRGYSSTGAPQVAGKVVVIGNAGAESDVRGYVTAYDLDTGAEVWRFYTVPAGPGSAAESAAMREALATWDPNSRWDIGGGGTVWDGMAYDAELDLIYIGVGNGGPYPQSIRSPAGGANLYLASIVALRASTGEVAWHYQQTPGDRWDYTATQPMVLTDLEIDGETVPVLMQAPKNGFFYILDRRNGKLLSAQKFARTNWASHVDLETGLPAIDEAAADYSSGPKIVFPATVGAHNWHPMAWDPERQLIYMSTAEMGNLIYELDAPDVPRRARRLNHGAALIFSHDLEAVFPYLPPHITAAVEQLPEWQDKEGLKGRSMLKAFDPLTGEERWSVPTSGWWDRSGVLATAGGVVFTGSDTGHFRAFDADSGELLLELEVGTSMLAAPMTYEVDGEQYVAIMAAWGGGGWSYPHPTSAQYRYGNAGRILAFRLGGGPVPIPEPLPPLGPVPEPPAQVGDAEDIARGQALFMANCAICHSNQERSQAPDLRRMSPGSHAAFELIVMQGLLSAGGMPSWDDVFDHDDLRALHAYLIDLQAEYAKRKNSGDESDSSGAPTVISTF
jgi:quinohemoprotein ethanol dehydrogenase